MKLYVRERMKLGEGVHEPRFRIMAIMQQGTDTGKGLKIEGTHFRKVELETIAQDLGAEIHYFKPMPEEERGTKREE
jgi:hypothetical protein